MAWPASLVSFAHIVSDAFPAVLSNLTCRQSLILKGLRRQCMDTAWFRQKHALIALLLLNGHEDLDQYMYRLQQQAILTENFLDSL